MPEHTSFLTYVLGWFPTFRQNAHNLGRVLLSPQAETVDYRRIEPVFCAFLVMAFVVFLAAGVRPELRSLDDAVIPDEELSTRTFLEAFVGYFYDVAKGVMGPKRAKRFFPIIGASGLFIFFSNALGLVPGMNPPTSSLDVTFGCAFAVFLAFNYYGIKENGWAYITHLAGPKWWLAVLIFPIEVISLCVRPITLAVRLFMNMAVDHLLGSIVVGMIGIAVPLPLMFLGIIVIVVQTLVFCLLTSIYIGLATEHSEGQGAH